MPKRARHLEVLEDSKNYFNKNKKTQLTKTIETAKVYEYRMIANIYAKSLNLKEPNILSYQSK